MWPRNNEGLINSLEQSDCRWAKKQNENDILFDKHHWIWIYGYFDCYFFTV